MGKGNLHAWMMQQAGLSGLPLGEGCLCTSAVSNLLVHANRRTMTNSLEVSVLSRERKKGKASELQTTVAQLTEHLQRMMPTHTANQALRKRHLTLEQQLSERTMGVREGVSKQKRICVRRC